MSAVTTPSTSSLSIINTSSGFTQTSGVNSVFSGYSQLFAATAALAVAGFVAFTFSAGASAILSLNQAAWAIGSAGNEVDQFILSAFVSAAPGIQTVSAFFQAKIPAGSRIAFHSLTADATHASQTCISITLFG